MRKLYFLFLYVLVAQNIGFAAFLERHGFLMQGLSHSRSVYIGSSDEMRLYQRGIPGANFDDGIFVAIPDGGPFNGYSYYSLNFQRIGFVDGWCAYLPTNPKSFIGSEIGHAYHTANPKTSPKEGFFRTWGIYNPGHIFNDLPGVDTNIKALPDNVILPKGTLFFWWISGGGSFSIPFGMIAPIKSDALTITAQITPQNEFEEIWFEASDTISATYKVYEMSPEEYNNQWKKTYQ